MRACMLPKLASFPTVLWVLWGVSWIYSIALVDRGEHDDTVNVHYDDDG